MKLALLYVVGVDGCDFVMDLLNIFPYFIIMYSSLNRKCEKKKSGLG